LFAIVVLPQRGPPMIKMFLLIFASSFMFVVFVYDESSKSGI